MNRALFLDKDGTLVENVPYNADPGRLTLAPGAVPALLWLARLGYRLIVISNQPGVALGYFAEEALSDVRERLSALLGDAGLRLAGFYYCPHHPAGVVARYARACDCRKPAAGLLTRAAREQRVRLEQSWFIGDILDDVEAGRRAGCRTVLLDNGNETEWRPGRFRKPHVTARDLLEAAERIVAADRASRASPREAATR